MADRLNPSGELRWFLVKSQPWKAKQVVSHVECEHKILSIGQSLTWRTGLILRENYGNLKKKQAPKTHSFVGYKKLLMCHNFLNIDYQEPRLGPIESPFQYLSIGPSLGF